MAAGRKGHAGDPGKTVGLVVAAALGGLAAVSWSVWIWFAFAAPMPGSDAAIERPEIALASPEAGR